MYLGDQSSSFLKLNISLVLKMKLQYVAQNIEVLTGGHHAQHNQYGAYPETLA